MPTTAIPTAMPYVHNIQSISYIDPPGGAGPERAVLETAQKCCNKLLAYTKTPRCCGTCGHWASFCATKSVPPAYPISGGATSVLCALCPFAPFCAEIFSAPRARNHRQSRDCRRFRAKDQRAERYRGPFRRYNPTSLDTRPPSLGSRQKCDLVLWAAFIRQRGKKRLRARLLVEEVTILLPHAQQHRQGLRKENLGDTHRAATAGCFREESSATVRDASSPPAQVPSRCARQFTGTICSTPSSVAFSSIHSKRSNLNSEA